MKDCIFCQIAKGQAPAHKVWEDDKYLAFLSIFPNTDGFTVIIPKEHHDSNFAQCSEEVVRELTRLAQIISRQICRAFAQSVERCALVYEGYGVNHLHAKLIPLHQTANREWQPILGKSDKFFEAYEGYITTQEPEKPADPQELSQIATQIREALQKDS